MSTHTKNKIMCGITTTALLGVEYYLARFAFFRFHGMKQWPNLLALIGFGIIILATIFGKRILSIGTLIGYIGGFVLAMIFNTDGVDPGGGATNNAWKIWGCIFILSIIAGLFIEIKPFGLTKNRAEKDLEKSYRLLGFWLLIYLLSAVLFGVLPSILDLEINSKLASLLWFNFTNLYLTSLFFMILKTERVYYINYITYKEAKEMSSKERKNFAYKHLKVFAIATIIYIIYSIFSCIYNYTTVIDIAAWIGILIITIIRIILIMLKKDRASN
ncbi:MAG: hypothetical protein GX080_07890 [Tissierellia bacterium]|nr:hypothetical protein [Tissierellia bacterium]